MKHILCALMEPNEYLLKHLYEFERMDGRLSAAAAKFRNNGRATESSPTIWNWKISAGSGIFPPFQPFPVFSRRAAISGPSAPIPIRSPP